MFARLFEEFGNPKAMERAIERAIPNRDKVNQLRDRISRIDEELVSIAKGRQRMIDRLAKGTTLDEAEVDQQLAKSKDRREQLQSERARLAEGLANIPGPESIKRQGQKVSASVQALIRAHGRTDLQDMSYEDKRALVESVFGGTGMDGKRLGVYITLLAGQEGKARGKQYRFTIRGHLIEHEGILSRTQSADS